MSYTLQPLSGQNILITGGLGFIGSNLAIKCLELGAKVTLLTHTYKNFKNIQDSPKPVTIVVGNITNYADVEKAVKDQNIIFHLAGQTSNVTSMESPELDININLIGTLNVLEVCRKTNPNAKILFAGTVTEHGKAEILPLREEQKDDPLSIYETNKLIAEKYLQIYHKAYGLHTCCLRLPTLFGERQQLNSPRFGITNFFLWYNIPIPPIGIWAPALYVGIVAYAMVTKQLFGIRVFLTQLLVGVISLLLFINLLSSETLFEYMWKGSLFVAFLIAGYLLVRSVMSEIKQREELQQAYAKLKELDEAKSEFVSIASHQLRTP
ncbi:MAG: NAD-dependent epimerase/dehydratase family protein, partial [Nanoarchaeota archaeon]